MHQLDNLGCRDGTYSGVITHQGVRVADRTVVAWMGNSEDTYAAEYDHCVGAWSGPVFVRTNPLPDGDFHGAPSIVADDDGYIHIFSACHHTGLKHTKSSAPGTLLGGMTARPDPFLYVTYPSSRNINGKLTVFCRNNSGHWGYKQSADNGVTWGPWKVILQANSGAWYYTTWQVDEAGDWHLAWCWWSKLNNYDHAPPHWEWRYNLYYLRLTADLTHAYNAAGASLPLPFPWLHSQALVVGTSPGERTNMPSMCLDGTTPHLLYTRGNPGGEWRIYHARLDGSTWIHTQITTNDDGFSSRSLVKKNGVLVAMLARGGDPGKGGNIERWESSDNGATWLCVRTVMSGNWGGVTPILGCDRWSYLFSEAVPAGQYTGRVYAVEDAD
jgi:hypothetical protein